MTKKVRIENADTSPYKVVVETWNGDKKSPNDVILNPTDICEAWVYTNQHLVIREAPLNGSLS
jgi:hypothetical protein